MVISVDIETDGPIPGKNSMLQLGLAIFRDNGKFVSASQENLDLLEGAEQDPYTMKWWETQGDLYEKNRVGTLPPNIVMDKINRQIQALRNQLGYPMFVAYPAGFDWMFIRWYAESFCQKPHVFTTSACLDIKSYAAGVLDSYYRNTTKRNMPKEWFKGLPKHTHEAKDDAIEQGMLYFNIKKWRRERVGDMKT